MFKTVIRLTEVELTTGSITVEADRLGSCVSGGGCFFALKRFEGMRKEQEFNGSCLNPFA